MDEITTDRLHWRPPVASDVEGYMAFVSDYEVVKWTATWPHPANREFVAARCVPVDPARGFAGPVFLGHEQIGGIGLVDGELGYFIARKHWSKGYATEIAAAVIGRAFQTLALDRVVASVMAGNQGSARVLEKLGFKQTGTSRCGCVARAREIDAGDFCLTRDVWCETRPVNETTRVSSAGLEDTPQTLYRRSRNASGVGR